MTINFSPSKLPELLNFDYQHIQNARERQCNFWQKQKLATPILFIGGNCTSAQQDIPEYDLKQIFTDQEKMLCREVRNACVAANGHSDMVPSIRANLGTGIALSTIGLEQEAFPDKMPWLKQHLTKEQASKLSPDDIQQRGSFARGMEMMHYFKEIMGDSVPIYVMDTQGPFDLAHMLLGDDLFIQLYDDRQFVHHIMTICLEIGLKTHHWMKKAIKEPITSLHHSNTMYSDSFGIRICEDTTVLLSPDHIDEFAMPYSHKLAQEFGGAWVHYCGYNEYLTDAILNSPEFKVLNFGHIPGHEDEIDFYNNMEKFQKAGKINFNHWPPLPEESNETYIKRLHRFAKQGTLAPIIWPDKHPSTQTLNTPEDILSFWRSL